MMSIEPRPLETWCCGNMLDNQFTKINWAKWL